MSNDSELSTSTEAALAVAGVVSVIPLPIPSGDKLVECGPAAGWFTPRGLACWDRELSFLARADMTAELGGALRATLPHEQVAPKKNPLVCKAIERSPFLPLTSRLVAEAQRAGVRVHTVGVDRVSAGFYYFAEGGTASPVRVQGNLVEMLAPSLEASTTNSEIAALQVRLIDRLLATFSGGIVSELAVELADALPRMTHDGTGLAGTHLEVFEVEARALETRYRRWAEAARELVKTLEAATSHGDQTTRVALFGEARQRILRPIKVWIGEGITELPAWPLWTVTGNPHDEHAASPKPPHSGPAPSPKPWVVVPRPSSSEPKLQQQPTSTEPKPPEAPAASSVQAGDTRENVEATQDPPKTQAIEGAKTTDAAEAKQDPSEKEIVAEEGSPVKRKGIGWPAILVVLVMAAAVAYIRWHAQLVSFVKDWLLP